MQDSSTRFNLYMVFQPLFFHATPWGYHDVTVVT